MDYSGQSASFAVALQEAGKTATNMSWMLMVDGMLPYGDIAYCAVVLSVFTVSLVESFASDSSSTSGADDAEEGVSDVPSNGTEGNIEPPQNDDNKKVLPQNGKKMKSSDALELADDFLGPDYTEQSPGRYVSSDGLRQVRMTNSDLSPVNNHAGGPHLNFETLAPNLFKPGKYYITGNSHIFIFE